MKYLKNIREKLSPQTYYNAANKLLKMGDWNTDRSLSLRSYADIKAKENDVIAWKKDLEEYSKYNKVNVTLTTVKGEMTDDFYLALDYSPIDYELTRDVNEWIKLDVLLIAPNKETISHLEKLIDTSYCYGIYLAFEFQIKLDLVNGEILIDESHLLINELAQFSKLRLNDRRSMGILKKTLSGVFSDVPGQFGVNGKEYKNFNTPEMIYDIIESNLLIENGFSVDYGLSMDDIKNHINNKSPNLFNV